ETVRRLAFQLICQLCPELEPEAARLASLLESDDPEARFSATRELVTLLPALRGERPQAGKGEGMDQPAGSELNRGRRKDTEAGERGTAEAPRWKAHLDLYQETRALTFKKQQELHAAIDLLWTEPLRELPHALAGGDTIIVPAEAVRYFKEQGLRFRNTR